MTTRTATLRPAAYQPLIRYGPWFVVAVALAVDLASARFLLDHPEVLAREIGGDRTIYLDAAQRWLDGGAFYPAWQVDAPYLVWVPAVLYPPPLLPLFALFTFLPEILWWVVPLGFTAAVVIHHRPGPWRIAAILACLAVPVSWTVLINGTPTIWMMAAIAAGTIWRWPFVLLFAKPTLAPLALLGVRDRRWWIVGAICAVASLAFLPLWIDWIAVVRNARGPEATPLYSLHDLPLLLIPLVGAAQTAPTIQRIRRAILATAR